MLIEYSNLRARNGHGGRLAQTENGMIEVCDLRKLGCPDWLATRSERRVAEKRAKVFGEVAAPPAEVVEQNTLVATAAALKTL